MSETPRTPLVCASCLKVETRLSTHLRRVCMRGSSDKQIKDAVASARKSLLEYAKQRVFDYEEIVECIIPEKIENHINRLEKAGIVIKNKPTLPSVPNEGRRGSNSTSSQPHADTHQATFQDSHELPTAENVEQEAGDKADDISEDAHFSRFQCIKWTTQARIKMQKAGLYKRHSLKAPLLKDYASYLQDSLDIKNYKQEVADVARFLFYMNNKCVNLNFVKNIKKVNHFFNDLKKILKSQTICRYLKHVRRFVTYQMRATNLFVKNFKLFKYCSFFLKVTDEMMKKIRKNISRDIVGKRFHSMLRVSKTPAECRRVLEVAKNSFLESIDRAESNQILSQSMKLEIIYYLEAVLVLKHLQRPGVVTNMTVHEWESRVTHQHVTPEGTTCFTVIGVQLHKSSTHQVAAFALNEKEETWFKTYFQHVRPKLVRNSTEEAFFVSSSGKKIYKVSNDLRRYHRRFGLPNITSQFIRRICETWTMKTCSDAEKHIFSSYLSHSNKTADRCYREKILTDLCHASLLVTRAGANSTIRGQVNSRTTEESEDDFMQPQRKIGQFTSL